MRLRFTAVIAAALLLVSSPARASLVLGIHTNQAIPGSSTNSFDVTLQNTGTDETQDAYIDGFHFLLSTTDTNVIFTQVLIDTQSVSYIFAGDSLFGPDITDYPTPGPQTIGAGDVLGTPSTTIKLAHGETLGLGRVIFSLAADAPPGQIPVQFAADPDTTISGFLRDESPIDLVIPPANETPINVVPEPAMIVAGLQSLFAVALPVLLRRTSGSR